MDSKIIKTDDGSVTLLIEHWNETYHSKFGAIKEAYHIFINSGLFFFKDKVSILEIGFGTGLNAFITLLESEKNNQTINYTSVDAFPIEKEKWKLLNYPEVLEVPNYQPLFSQIHECAWNEYIDITDKFTLNKQLKRFQDINVAYEYDLIFFDAFSARVQPDLWEPVIFQKMYTSLKKKGILVTYASNAKAQKSLISSGFKIKKLLGPEGRREMLRATKGDFIL